MSDFRVLNTRRDRLKGIIEVPLLPTPELVIASITALAAQA